MSYLTKTFVALDCSKVPAPNARKENFPTRNESINLPIENSPRLKLDFFPLKREFPPPKMSPPRMRISLARNETFPPQNENLLRSK